MRTRVLTRTSERQLHPLAILAHPTDLARRHTDDQCIGGNVLIDHGTRTDETELANLHSTDNRAIGAKACPSSYDRVAILILPFDERARIVYVGEYHARADENPLLERNVVVDR